MYHSITTHLEPMVPLGGVDIVRTVGVQALHNVHLIWLWGPRHEEIAAVIQQHAMHRPAERSRARCMDTLASKPRCKHLDRTLGTAHIGSPGCYTTRDLSTHQTYAAVYRIDSSGSLCHRLFTLTTMQTTQSQVDSPGGDLRKQDLVAVPEKAPAAGRQFRHAAVCPVVQHLQQGGPVEALLLRLVHQLVQRGQQHLHKHQRAHLP